MLQLRRIRFNFPRGLWPCIDHRFIRSQALPRRISALRRFFRWTSSPWGCILWRLAALHVSGDDCTEFVGR